MSSFEIQYLVTQYGLLLGQLGIIGVTVYFYRKLVANDNLREERARADHIKHICKCLFRTGKNSPGEMQRAGQTARERYPGDMDLILIAYDELRVEEPTLKLDSLSDFLGLMNLCEDGMWPLKAEAMAGRLKLY